MTGKLIYLYTYFLKLMRVKDRNPIGVHHVRVMKF